VTRPCDPALHQGDWPAATSVTGQRRGRAAAGDRGCDLACL